MTREGPNGAVSVTAAVLLSLLREAAGLVVADGGAQVGRVTRKADGTLVTAADLAVEAFLRPRLMALCPEAAWVGEESAPQADRLAREWAWVIDPLDGTKEFASGIPECAISVGLVRDGDARAGAVLNPFDGMAAAVGTDGSWMQAGEAGDRAVADDLISATASVSRTEIDNGIVTPHLGRVGSVRPLGSVAYKLLRVALGHEDLTFSVQPKSEWDLCGGAALIAARGLAFARLDGRPLRFNQPVTRIPDGFAAGPEHLVRSMVVAIRTREPRLAD